MFATGFLLYASNLVISITTTADDADQLRTFLAEQRLPVALHAKPAGMSVFGISWMLLFGPLVGSSEQKKTIQFFPTPQWTRAGAKSPS